MSAEVVISLPGASQFDAEAFGLWLECMLRLARERQELDMEYGTISVPPAGSRSAKAAKRKAARDSDERPDPNVLIDFVWRRDGTFNYRWWPEGPITPENAEVIVAGVLADVSNQIHAKIATRGNGNGASHGQ